MVGASDQKQGRAHKQQQEAERAGGHMGSGNFLFPPLIGDPAQSCWKWAQLKKFECWYENNG
jgi:hypothetical protein